MFTKMFVSSYRFQCHCQEHTLMFLMKSAEASERQMFSGRENCCRIPPADKTVEFSEY